MAILDQGGLKMENKKLIEVFRGVYTAVALTLTAVIFLVPVLTV